MIESNDERLAKLPEHALLPARPDEAFDRIASVVRRILKVDVALVSLVDKTQQVFPGAQGLPEALQTQRSTPLSHSFCQHVVADASAFVVVDARTNDKVKDNPAIDGLGVIAYAGMPLIDFDGRVVGSLCAIDDKPREWTADELVLLNDLAAACSAELQLRESVQRTAAASARWQVLSHLSEALLSVTTVDEIAETVDVLAKTQLGANFGGLALLNEATQSIHYVDLSPFAEVVQQRRDFSLWEDRPAAIAARLRSPLFFRTIAEMEEMAPGSATAARSTQGKSFAYLPMIIREQVVGILFLIWNNQNDFLLEDRQLLEGLARYTAQAVDRAALIAERRDVAETLQAALLPSMPTADWVTVESTYKPSPMADAVGGDWFDAFCDIQSDAKERSVMTVVVGDVTGHDTAAAAVMGQLQAGLRALALDNSRDPNVLLERLDYVMDATFVSRMATAIVATLTQQADGSVLFSWSNAGHLPPLLVRPDEPARYLEKPVDLLLGVKPDTQRQMHSVVLPTGSSVILFTDGLVERSGTNIVESLDRLLAVVEQNRQEGLDVLIQTVVDSALEDGHDDDAVIFGISVP